MADDREAFARAREMIRALCSGEKTWEMNVPARVFEDPDLVLAAAVTLGESLLADRDRLAAENARLREAAEALLRLFDDDGHFRGSEELFRAETGAPPYPSAVNAFLPWIRKYEAWENKHALALRAVLAARSLTEAQP